MRQHIFGTPDFLALLVGATPLAFTSWGALQMRCGTKQSILMMYLSSSAAGQIALVESDFLVNSIVECVSTRCGICGPRDMYSYTTEVSSPQAIHFGQKIGFGAQSSRKVQGRTFTHSLSPRGDSSTANPIMVLGRKDMLETIGDGDAQLQNSAKTRPPRRESPILKLVTEIACSPIRLGCDSHSR